MTTTPHDATLFADSVYRKTPAETAAEVEAAYKEARADYQATPRESHSQYNQLTGQPDTSAPTLTALVPNTAVVGGANFTISVQGTKFDENTVIWWKDHEEPTTFVSANEVTTGVVPSSIGAPEVLPISVRNNDVSSNVLNFTFTAAQEDEPQATPTDSWKKADIRDWLIDQGYEAEDLQDYTKAELLELVEDELRQAD